MPSPADIVATEPASGVEIARFRPGDVPSVLAAAKAAWPRWAELAPSARSDALRRLGSEIRREAEPLAALIAREIGKPLWEAHREVEAALARIDSAARSHAERCPQRRHDSALQGASSVRHRPLGVMAVISPFCEPLAAAIDSIAPALIAGNVVVFKPSERATATGAALVDCATRSGLPSGVLHLLPGDGDVGRELVAHEAVDGVLFTGSTPVGQQIARKLAPRPDKLLWLALGGNSPVVVWDTPLLDDAAALVVQSAFGGAGQRALAARRLIVRDTLAEPLLERVKALADRIICGAPFDDPAPFMGPVIDTNVADGLTQSFIWLMSNGGKPIKHMQRLHPDLPFLSPAIIDVTAVADRPDVELYGPLLQVVRVADFDAALNEANATRYGLAAALIGGNPQQFQSFWARARAGAVHWNRATTTALPAAPFGGVGLSGNYRAGGPYMADSCAFPVASCELETPRGVVGVGFTV